MLEREISRGSGLSVVGEEIFDEAFSVLGDGLPDAVLEGDLALTNLLHDVSVGLTVEGGHAREQDVGDNTAGPDVALVVVVFVQHFGGDIVGGAQLLIEVTLGVVDEGSTEIDDLDLIELFVLLK